MEIYTLNVGQGSFVVVTGTNEAFIVDSYVPENPDQKIIDVEETLNIILEGKKLVGLIISDFKEDYFNENGLKIILENRLPGWIMHPTYFLHTENADRCFELIKSYDPKNTIKSYPVTLTNNVDRYYSNLAKEFNFELFSPHKEDLFNAYNSSLVCRVEDRIHKTSYLITGDTDERRWGSIVQIFFKDLSCDVMAAPQHGSKAGITRDLLHYSKPHTVLISAGMNNKLGHPDELTCYLLDQWVKVHFQTNEPPDGQSIKTILNKYKTIINHKYP